ncbi:hypothetical protein LCGC14_0400310 [marine sediment metagenome]|uniref:Uncharacterized protein n=1 Tax=marine sediment metagenome TaxID=412755 RepID=A0A0F9VIW1_9ZZZZ
MLIKSRNFSPNKTELTFEQSGFGWAPGQEKKFEGRRTPGAVKNFRKGYDRIDWSRK